MNALYLAASGAVSQLTQLDTAASNLSNASTPGFRRLFTPIEATGGNDSPYEFAAASSPRLDLDQGPINQTGNPLDVAVIGPAFITVSTPQGPAYTRNGALQLAPDGSLLAAGQPVESAAGGALKLPPGPVAIASDGSVSVAGTPAGRIALANPAEAGMVALGASLYGSADGEPLAPADAGSALRQGFLESSTGSAISSMVAMMGAMRSYQATMNSIKAVDQNTNQAAQAFTLQA